MVKQFKTRPNKNQAKVHKVQPIKQEEKEPKIEQGKVQDIKQQQKGESSKRVQHSKSKGKRNRLIIRNLVFDINQKHLRKLLLPYGQIEDLQVPPNPNNSKCNRGFAFVQFKNYRSCQKAIKQLNQSTYKGRVIVLDFSINKQRFMTTKLEEEIAKPDGQNKKIEQPNQEKIQAQVEQQKEEQVQIDKEEVIQRHREKEDLSSTIFIRNLPISVTQQQLRDFFTKYGKLRWARVVIDKETNTPKGTAFVRFVDSQIAHEIIQYSRSYEMFLLNKNPRFKSDPKFTLEIDGTILKIFPGEKRQVIADKMKEREEMDAQRDVKVKPLKKIKKLKDLIAFDKDGKRRIALAEYGLWQANDEMSEEDRQRFISHSKQKMLKLKNPNNSVSDKRIILKFLNKNITEEQLKDLAFEFLNAHKLKPKELTYCKLMLDNDRKKSAGFAFIEFAHHENSKKFIEQLTQNYKYLMPQPYVIEFAIQDSRKIQKILNSKK